MRRAKHRSSYHHGNLREALISAALNLISEKGPTGFTFAEAARLAGVSPAAPYRHFRDRDALMADIALRGFERFEAELAKAWKDGEPDALTALERLGRAYLTFARKNPAYYAAMFEAALPFKDNPDLLLASERAFGVLQQAAQAMCADLPEATRPPALMMSFHIWALAHGIASLFGRGDEAGRKLPVPADDLLEAGILLYLKGAGLDLDKRT